MLRAWVIDVVDDVSAPDYTDAGLTMDWFVRFTCRREPAYIDLGLVGARGQNFRGERRWFNWVVCVVLWIVNDMPFHQIFND